MKDDNASERAAALLQQTIDVLQRIENAPDSPVNAFVPGKMRRHLRRGAEGAIRDTVQCSRGSFFVISGGTVAF